ncbi:hypothetical protein BJ165DRAFT_1490052 [Panaeolus papilionaceus]|nr:hypothetical protein BJ165DRAFT_1490052 [Panaeolus papilionaceus]
MRTTVWVFSGLPLTTMGEEEARDNYNLRPHCLAIQLFFNSHQTYIKAANLYAYTCAKIKKTKKPQPELRGWWLGIEIFTF